MATKSVKKSSKAAKLAKTAKGEKEVKHVATQEVTIDRRGAPDRRHRSEAVLVERRALQRREKVTRRRQIDPTTCERDYSDQEVEFMNALDLYKRKSGRMFPTCSEVLEVLRGLGYEKRTVAPAPAASETNADATPAADESTPTIAG